MTDQEYPTPEEESEFFDKLTSDKYNTVDEVDYVSLASFYHAQFGDAKLKLLIAIQALDECVAKQDWKVAQDAIDNIYLNEGLKGKIFRILEYKGLPENIVRILRHGAVPANGDRYFGITRIASTLVSFVNLDKYTESVNKKQNE